MTSSSQRRYRLGVLLGDGIGPEIVPRRSRWSTPPLAAAGADPSTGTSCRWAAPRSTSTQRTCPSRRSTALADLDGWLLGPHDSAAYPEPYKSQLNPSGTIRKHFDLYANIRPAKAFEGGNGDRARTPTW